MLEAGVRSCLYKAKLCGEPVADTALFETIIVANVGLWSARTEASVACRSTPMQEVGVGGLYSCRHSVLKRSAKAALSACFAFSSPVLAHQLLMVFVIDGHVVQHYVP